MAVLGSISLYEKTEVLTYSTNAWNEIKVTVEPGERDSLNTLCDALLPRDLQLILQVNVARGQKGVDAVKRGMPYGLRRVFVIVLVGCSLVSVAVALCGLKVMSRHLKATFNIFLHRP